MSAATPQTSFPRGTASRTGTSGSVEIVGTAPQFQRSLTAARRAAACAAPVVIEGETGTGKELIAWLIHRLSDRAKKGFVPVNCGCLPGDLVENELFGHAAGAFTSAQTASTGLVQEADAGTLFLDEVDTLCTRAQVALLRFLQQGEVRQVGSGRTARVNCRIVAAANRSLQQLVAEGTFREDLFFRLNVLEVALPPLRARRDDLPALVRYFLSRFGNAYGKHGLALSEGAMDWVVGQDWPGNVRELENAMHRAVLTADQSPIPVEALCPGDPSQCSCAPCHERAHGDDDMSRAGGPIEPFADAKARAIADWERGYLTRLMDRAEGNVTAAAELAGKERRALGKLLKKHGLSGGAQQDLAGGERPVQ